MLSQTTPAEGSISLWCCPLTCLLDHRVRWMKVPAWTCCSYRTSARLSQCGVSSQSVAALWTEGCRCLWVLVTSSVTWWYSSSCCNSGCGIVDFPGFLFPVSSPPSRSKLSHNWLGSVQLPADERISVFFEFILQACLYARMHVCISVNTYA